MTTRKLAALPALAAVALALGGCATPGPRHVYSLASGTAAEIRDDGPAPAPAVPGFLAPGETITGFAYDPFTDHFFLRLAPGNRLRVVDRPARAVKREFTVAQLPATGGGDLAVCPRDGHLFFTLPHAAALIETTRFGEFVRTIGLASPAAGVAFDSAHDRILVLFAPAAIVASLDRAGVPVATVSLAPAVQRGSVGYDADRHEFYVPLADRTSIGVFDENGRLTRTPPVAAELLDVGPRSFLRMF
jgi:hypothetical protein